jgi:hypothetical protein
MIEMTRAEPVHAAIVPYLRRADVEEIWAATGLSPAFAVAYSIAHSRDAWAILLNGKPAGVFGAGAAGKDIGVPWLVATEEIERHPVRFYRVSRAVIEKMRQRYAYLTNWVDARNTLSIRWLEWAGFTVEPPRPYGAAGLGFCRFWWRKGDANP